MFRQAHQSGFLTIFYSIGSHPLKNWKCQSRNGHCRRLMDEDLNSTVLEIWGENISTCMISIPAEPYQSLGIKMPFVTIIMKNLQKYCTFEIEVRDHENQLRRFQASTFQPHTRTSLSITQMPLRLESGWNKIEINLADFTHRAYGTRYIETVYVRINANIRLRRIYFSDQLYSEEEKPREYRICIPKMIQSSCGSETGSETSSNTTNPITTD